MSQAEEEGLVNVVSDAETDRSLGVHILGAGASDMIVEAMVLVSYGIVLE